jgi:hypothetical protein
MTYPHTAVSGYWIVKNKHDNKYLSWFRNTLRINTPYVFFGTQETIKIAKQFRGDLPTHYVELAMEDMYCAKYRDRLRTHPSHCPSVELGIIWHEKLFLMEQAAALNPFGSEWFSWIDAGVCTYRNSPPPTTPFPDPLKLQSLPSDKVLYTSSVSPTFEPHRLDRYNNNHYHHVSGTYMIHTSTLPKVIQLYKEYLEQYLNQDTLASDQVILTYIYKDHPALFHKTGHGYGAILKLLL